MQMIVDLDIKLGKHAYFSIRHISCNVYVFCVEILC